MKYVSIPAKFGLVLHQIFLAQPSERFNQSFPSHQGMGIAGTMVEKIKEKYQNYLYLEGMPEERKNASFYAKHGFRVMPDGVPMQICNFADRR